MARVLTSVGYCLLFIRVLSQSFRSPTIPGRFSIRGGNAVANGRGGTKRVSGANTKKADKPTTAQAKATCTTGTVCFTAGTLIETSEGLKAIETFTGGELIWTRNDITLEYGYRPVIATKATPDQPIFQVTVKNHQGDIDTLETTAEHPFWIKDTGWLKASLLEQGMILLDRNNQEVEVLSQYLLPNHTDTVYNIEVDDFHTYHVGRLGVWVHNADCCGNDTSLASKWSNIEFSSRHSLESLSVPKKTGNTIVYASKKDINADIKEIREKGESIRSGNTFKVSSGRVYEIHGNSVHPVSGLNRPGIVGDLKL